MHQKSEGESVKSDLKKLDSLTLEMSKNQLIRNFLRNGRLRVKPATGRHGFSKKENREIKMLSLPDLIILSNFLSYKQLVLSEIN